MHGRRTLPVGSRVGKETWQTGGIPGLWFKRAQLWNSDWKRLDTAASPLFRLAGRRRGPDRFWWSYRSIRYACRRIPAGLALLCEGYGGAGEGFHEDRN